MQQIKIRGARTHNLKNIDLNLPRNKLVVITGLSGSGKSSLAFDTLYAEAQKRYIESLSLSARQFCRTMADADVDSISGLSPAIAIGQTVNPPSPRATVGTITDIYDYLRLLFANVGQVQCPQHKHILHAQPISQIIDSILLLPVATKIMILAPLGNLAQDKIKQVIQDLYRQGFLRVRIDGKIYELDQLPSLDGQRLYNIAIIVDRLKVSSDNSSRLASSLTTAVNLSSGFSSIALWDSPAQDSYIFSANFACHECGYSLTELTPSLFSFNSPNGACQNCNGLGSTQELDRQIIISNPQLSLAQGAIPYWSSNNNHSYQQILHCVAQHYNFSLDSPFAELPPAIQEIILYGSEEQIALQYQDGHGNNFVRNQQFIGAIPYLKRRYQTTQSPSVRAKLAAYFTSKTCDACNGQRLCLAARNVIVSQYNLPTIANWPIAQILEFFNNLSLVGYRRAIADKILPELTKRLSLLNDLGLGYLTLNRSAVTLSGGEMQRMRLAAQIGAALVGVIYVLDEPSIGLHQRDNAKLLRALFRLRDLGNTVVVVEHDAEAIMAADYVVDLGPGAGVNGGTVIAIGSAQTIMQTTSSLTGQYLNRRQQIAVPTQRLAPNPQKMIKITGASFNNLKNLDVSLPIGLLCGITGVSGSGKSTLINGTLMPVAAHILNGSKLSNIGRYPQITGLDACDRLVVIDQNPLGRTPRSNPATYLGIFTLIRQLFAGVSAARVRGYQERHFSFNAAGGRCAACQGDGVMQVAMHFLADVAVVCDVCQGKRYNRETLAILYQGKNINQVLTMNVAAAYDFFTAIPMITRKLKLLLDVGLGYLTLGQNANTLSGGEAQRIKLAKELSRPDTGKTLYLLDEPTTGLHFHDVAQLLAVLQKLRDHGNTIIIIEHNLDVIKACDWLIDLGPEGGEHGGKILAVGTPEQVAQQQYSHTGLCLHKMLQQPLFSRSALNN